MLLHTMNSSKEFEADEFIAWQIFLDNICHDKIFLDNICPDH